MRFFRRIFLFIFLAELISFSGFLWPAVNFAGFFAVIILTLILSLKRIEYGLAIALIELIIGSKGYLFFLEISGMTISIRIALWIIIMSVWLGRLACAKIKTNSSPLIFPWKKSNFKYFLGLFAFVGWGIVNGFLNRHSFNNIFFDANGWLYFLYIFPVFQAAELLPKKDFFRNSLIIFKAAVAWLVLKTFFLLFIFSHNIVSIMPDIYRWVRVSGVGEITNMQGGFYRIFFQSHIFILIAFFLVLAQIGQETKFLRFFQNRRNLVSVCLFSVILISFSRSNWAGLAVGLLLFSGLIIWIYGLKKFLKIPIILIVIFIFGFSLIAATVKFPYPIPTGGFNTAELLSERAGQVSGEAGVSSRWNLLPELWAEIKKAPILGQGFGADVTYISNDPRVGAQNPDGKYTTFAFEWGWLDIWLKLGFFGVLSYLWLLFIIVFRGLKQIKQGETDYQPIILGLTVGLFTVAAVSFFSPYMNHPLGIGYLIFSSALIYYKSPNL